MLYIIQQLMEIDHVNWLNVALVVMIVVGVGSARGLGFLMAMFAAYFLLGG